MKTFYKTTKSQKLPYELITLNLLYRKILLRSIYKSNYIRFKLMNGDILFVEQDLKNLKSFLSFIEE